MNEFDIHKNDPMAIGLRKKRKEKEAMWDRFWKAMREEAISKGRALRLNKQKP